MDATFCRMGCGADMRRLNLLNNCWIYAYTSDSRWFDDSINFV